MRTSPPLRTVQFVAPLVSFVIGLVIASTLLNSAWWATEPTASSDEVIVQSRSWSASAEVAGVERAPAACACERCEDCEECPVVPLGSASQGELGVVQLGEVASWRVGLYISQFDYRGTGRGLLDYGRVLQKHGATVIIFTAAKNRHGCKDCTEDSIKRYEDRFKTIVTLEHGADIKRDVAAIQATKLDVLFVIKGGAKRDLLPSSVQEAILPVPTVNQCVFSARDRHGTVWAKISPWVPGDALVVPRMVTLPTTDRNLRAELGIPTDALVLCRHGGMTTFDDRMIQSGVVKSLSARNDVHYVFLSTKHFGPQNHPRMHFLPAVGRKVEVRAFINSCDGMVYGRRTLETFGMAIAEFSICNKFIIANRAVDGFHRYVLRDNMLLVSTADEFAATVRDIDREAMLEKNWDAYTKHFGEEPVTRALVHVLSVAIDTGRSRRAFDKRWNAVAK